MKPLTKEQADFAAEHHNLIYSFLYKNRYSIEDFYDIAAFGYLRAVSSYLEREELRIYAFSTIAFRRMRYAILDHLQAENRPALQLVSRPYDEDADRPVYDDEPWAVPEHCLAVKERRKTLLRVLTPRQNQVVSLRANGYSLREIGRRVNMKPGLIKQELSAAGAAIYELAPELLDIAA